MSQSAQDLGIGREALERRLSDASDLVTVALDALLPRADGPEQRLTEAMRYAALGPGRRLRPFFALEAAKLFDIEERSVLRAACALECIHAYSLVHDDLPAMDDDDYRRGRPAVHRAYDEATALLAGDALQSFAFEILAHPDTHDEAEVRIELTRRLARAAGAQGLAGGQMIDILGIKDDPGVVVRMQRLKTGALIGYAFEIAVILAQPSDAKRQALLSFAQDLGLAYQILDDVTDAEADRRKTSKKRPAKANFVTLMGVDEARARLSMLREQCCAHLDIFGARATYLRESADFVLDR